MSFGYVSACVGISTGSEVGTGCRAQQSVKEQVNVKRVKKIKENTKVNKSVHPRESISDQQGWWGQRWGPEGGGQSICALVVCPVDILGLSVIYKRWYSIFKSHRPMTSLLSVHWMGLLPLCSWSEELKDELWNPANKVSRPTERLITQLGPTLCNPMDYSPPGSSVCGVLQARILEWVAIPFSSGSSRSRDRIWVSCTAGRFFLFIYLFIYFNL